jgi:hypothetical protein
MTTRSTGDHSGDSQSRWTSASGSPRLPTRATTLCFPSGSRPVSAKRFRAYHSAACRRTPWRMWLPISVAHEAGRHYTR